MALMSLSHSKISTTLWEGVSSGQGDGPGLPRRPSPWAGPHNYPANSSINITCVCYECALQVAVTIMKKLNRVRGVHCSLQAFDWWLRRPWAEAERARVAEGQRAAGGLKNAEW